MHTNPSEICNILTLRYNPKIKPLLPIKTWDRFQPDSTVLSIGDIENSILDSLKQKIESNKIKKISIALSGGIDSTLILAMLRKLFPDIEIEAITIKFAESVDESPVAAKIAQNFEANHHIVYLENYLEELPKAISIIKMPFWDLHWYHVVKKSQSLSKYLASGDGGDELFGGYTFRYKKFLSLTTQNSTPLDKVKAYLQCHERDRVPDQEDLFDAKAEFTWDAIYKTLLPYFDNSLPSLDQVFLADYNGKLLYNFSPVNTRILNHFLVEGISPLLSDLIIGTATRIPNVKKYDQNKNLGKLPLRELLKRYNAISFVTDQKLGFNVDTKNLWELYGKSICTEYLLDSSIVSDGWINKKWITSHINRSDLDVRYINKFLGLLAFEIWYRLFVTRDMNANTRLN
ncbi:MAG TPA: asparagine synthase [Candidatus Nitrosopelagicus sp.]|nr:asparagine synthase [Candidatus Nitrosopelagicus sp.]HIA97094.1 asparagine synthase [Candidatus Nitrosopelagicus sp.]